MSSPTRRKPAAPRTAAKGAAKRASSKKTAPAAPAVPAAQAAPAEVTTGGAIPALRVRRDLMDFQREYDRGNKRPLETLMRAWKGIKELPPEDPRSFFSLGGLHGEPFRGAGWGNSAYWGGYCNHGNVLFPTWHRAYLLKLEEALRSIPGCADVTLPYWDETTNESVTKGIPKALTDQFFVLDGQKIPNPLRSFVFTKGITDNINGDNPNYSKPLGYETVRYPLSGLVGTQADREATQQHNSLFPNYDQNVAILNGNIVNWLGAYIVVNGKRIPTGVKKKFEDCLKAPNYTVFSNTTSAQEWNNGLPAGTAPIVPLESPHNSLHLAVGGYDVPSGPNAGDFSPIQGANGDMGENDTAGLDPIFYFHHCNIDRVFWLWQLRHGATGRLEIIPGYPGTNSVDNQGPTPGITPNSWLTMETPLNPFQRPDGRTYTSNDLVNIEAQLGYTYAPGSLAAPAAKARAAEAEAEPGGMLRVSGINRAPVRGSFLISAYAHVGGKRQLLGTEAVLSRWNVAGCANCQTHLEVKAFFHLPEAPKTKAARALAAEAGPAQYEVEVRGRDGVLSAPGGDRRGQRLMPRVEVR